MTKNLTGIDFVTGNEISSTKGGFEAPISMCVNDGNDGEILPDVSGVSLNWSRMEDLSASVWFIFAWSSQMNGYGLFRFLNISPYAGYPNNSSVYHMNLAVPTMQETLPFCDVGSRRVLWIPSLTTQFPGPLGLWLRGREFHCYFLNDFSQWPVHPVCLAWDEILFSQWGDSFNKLV